MHEQRNTENAKRSYELFKAGDVESLMNLYTEDADWETPDTANVPHGGKRKGREQMMEFFSLVLGNMQNLHFEPREFVAQDKTVVILGDYGWRINSTGKEFTSDFVHVLTFEDAGKITSFKEHLDTAKTRDAYTAGSAQGA